VIVKQLKRSGRFVKKSDSDKVGGGADRKTRWNYVESRNQIDAEARPMMNRPIREAVAAGGGENGGHDH